MASPYWLNFGVLAADGGRMTRLGGVVTTALAGAVAAVDFSRLGDWLADSPHRGLLIRSGIVAVSVVLAALLLWVRSQGGARTERNDRSVYDDLIGANARLVSASSTAEVERIAVTEAMRMVDADIGAFVRSADGSLTIGFESSPGTLLPDRLAQGVLAIAGETGTDLMRSMRSSSNEPALRGQPKGLIVSPVLSSRTVAGLLVMARDSTPFADDDLRALTALKPMVGTALGSLLRSERAETVALTDGLTGVLNRRALDQAIEHRGPLVPISVIMVDLDHFKRVNDAHGHQAGDDLLSGVASRLAANVRPGDVVYRYGGEEFAVLLFDAVATAATTVAERLRFIVSATPFVIGDGIEHRTTASFGVAVGVGGTEVLGRADAALYRAKEAGRNHVELDASST